MSSLKTEIRDALLRADYERVVEFALKQKKVLTILISLAYDKEDVLCWRAIEAMGRAAGAVAEKDPSAARNIAQRLLWSMGEESGSIGWSAAEMLGEIVRNSPALFSDLPPIILSFHEEEMFLKGVLWAMGRMAEVGVKADGAEGVALGCLGHQDPSVRGLAALALSRLNGATADERLREMIGDEGKAVVYDGSRLAQRTVGEMAKAVLAENRSSS